MNIKEGSSSNLDKYRKYKHIHMDSVFGHAPEDELQQRAMERVRKKYIAQNLIFAILLWLVLVFGLLVGEPGAIIMSIVIGVLALIFSYIVISTIKYDTQVTVAKCVSPNTIVTRRGRHSSTTHYVTVVFEEKQSICDIITDKKSSEWMEEDDIIYIVRVSEFAVIGILEEFVKSKK